MNPLMLCSAGDMQAICELGEGPRNAQREREREREKVATVEKTTGC